MLVLHLCKVSCLCRCIVQRLGSADISVLAYNFWQATKASLLWAWPQGGSQGRQSPYSPPARMPGVYAQGLCTMQSQPSIHSLSRGKGVFGKDAKIRTHQALHEAKPTKHTQPFTGKRGFRQGCRNKDTPSFARSKANRVS